MAYFVRETAVEEARFGSICRVQRRAGTTNLLTARDADKIAKILVDARSSQVSRQRVWFRP
jgi:hypothetical protein